jgi:[protein-PII] uridylyltransferase
VKEVAVLPPPGPEEVQQTLAGRTSEVEERVRQAYARSLEPSFRAGLAVVAVGGFGRGELFPHSDIDLLLLAESDKVVPPRENISAFLQGLWDSGLRPSHSVHSVADCVIEHDDNAEFTISLLDRRLLAGDAALFQTLDDKFKQFQTRRGPALARAIAGLAEGRRAKYQNTIYHLEPNVKETPGGLRDLQTTRWLLMLEPREGTPDLTPALNFLSAVRLRLHELAGRDQNALSFNAQETLSDHPAALMRDYYRQARVVDQAVRQAIEVSTEKAGTLLGRFHEWRSRLSTSDFTVSRDRVLLRSHQPPQDLSLFEFVARHGLRLAPDTIERLQSFTPEAKWDDWKRLLSLPKASLGLRAMQEAGVLPHAIPEWRNIECLVVRDFYHRYTVDEHTLVAIGSLEAVTDGRFADLMSEIEDPWLVRFALLMHDIGKGSGREHTVASVEIARAVMDRLGTPDVDRETIEFLVLRHLDLSSVMSSRDLYDGSTARALADRVGTLERLKLLTMLTYADISAVNPQAMTPWRMEQLWRVYLMAYEELTRELVTERIHDAAGMPAERARFLEGLPTRYLRTHTPQEIDAHFALAKQLASRPVAVEILHERGFYKLTLLTQDRPALFASVAGAISSFGLNILKAEAFSNVTGMVLDTFTFADPHRTLELNPPEVDRLRGVVRKVVEGKQDADKLLRGRPKPFLSSRMKLRPRVSFKDDASDGATLIEIVSEDRPGLLYDLANAISLAGCNIEVVMIDTEAHKALDVFYVTHQGHKLGDQLQSELKSELLAACIGSR